MTKTETLNKIARHTLDLATLETRHSDGLDFSDQAVWNIKEALEAAYEAGKREATISTPYTNTK